MQRADLKERALIATRTKAALAAAKARGVKLGGPKLAEARKVALELTWPTQIKLAANVLPVIRKIQRSGASLHQVAEALNARGISTPRGGDGTPSLLATCWHEPCRNSRPCGIR